MIYPTSRVGQAAEEVARRLVEFAVPVGHPLRYLRSTLNWTRDGEEFRGAWVTLDLWVPAAEVEAQLERKGG